MPRDANELRGRWAMATLLSTLLGVMAVMAVPMVANPGPACRSERPGPDDVVFPVCISDWSAKAQSPYRLEFADEADLVLRIVLILGVLAALPLLVRGRLRRSTTIVVAAGAVSLILVLWLVAPLPALVLTPGGLAALAAAAQALQSGAAARSP
jgi:hypothetical protein